jgi:hypothetical protein
MTDTEDNITRFRKCRKIQLKDLMKFSVMFLGVLAILSILIRWVYGFEYFTQTWIDGIITLSLLDLAWYMIILFNCNRLASSTRSDCISECREKYCISKCPNEAYIRCINTCREIFGYEP